MANGRGIHGDIQKIFCDVLTKSFPLPEVPFLINVEGRVDMDSDDYSASNTRNDQTQ